MRYTQAVYRLAVRLEGNEADKRGEVTLGTWKYLTPSSVQHEINELESINDEVDCFIVVSKDIPGNCPIEYAKIKDLLIYNPNNPNQVELINKFNTNN